MKKFYWSAYSNKPSVSNISEIQDIINNYGYIIDFKRYSDLTLALIVEVDECKIEKLYMDLRNHLTLSDWEILQNPSESECILFLNITFSGTGKIKIEVPDIPG